MCGTTRSVILVLVKHFEPAFRFGGPIRSVANLTSVLSKEFEFRIICLNRDFREASPLDGISCGVWLQRNGAFVYYLDTSLSNPWPLVRAIRSTNFDVLYLNSFFEPLFSILPALLMKFGLVARRPLIVAPRGEFSPGALQLRPLKKRTFLLFESYLGLYRNALWQATTALESDEIKTVLGPRASVHLAGNLAERKAVSSRERPKKIQGALNIVFVSRIAPKKNLNTLILALLSIEGRVTLDIWGPVYDLDYWKQCQQLLATLPDNVIAKYRGETPHEQVPEVFGEAHLFVLPTLGENFGHVIQEAWSAGCPVVISDRTPWLNLADQGVGFDVPLENPKGLSRAIQTFIDMDPEDYASYASRCRAYALNSRSEDEVDASRQMFRLALGLGLA